MKMFYNCKSLKSLDLSKFITSEVNNMQYMFFFCRNLTSLIISSFDTSNVINMNNMFHYCSSIKLLNLSNFDTSKVSDMENMFRDCRALVSINLSNFNTSQVSKMNYIFIYCYSLEFINLEDSLIYKGYFSHPFSEISLKAIICSNDYGLFGEYIIYNISIQCIFNGNINKIYKCFKKTTTKYYNKYICNKCGNNYYQINNDPNNSESNINCYKLPYGYYLDNSGIYQIIKPCFLSCKTCDRDGNETFHNCFECKGDYKFEQSMGNYKNCFNIQNADFKNISEMESLKINYETELENEIISSTEITSIINTRLINKKNISATEMISNKDLLINNITEFNSIFFQSNSESIMYDNTPPTYKIKNSTIKKNLNNITDLIEYLINEFNKSYIDNGNDFKISQNNMLFSITNSRNQKHKGNSNEIVIDLKYCENILKATYNISEDGILYIIIIEVREYGMKIPKIEYNVYYPFFDDNLIQLNLSFCQGEQIDISIPVSLNESLDKHNPRSDYYNNICFKAISDSGADIPLKDRKNEFIDKNLTLCEEECSLTGYNYTLKKVKCSCPVKIKIPFLEDIKFDKKKLYKNFIDIKNIANINFLKCYKNAFKGESLRKNYCFFIYIFLFIIYFLSLFLFYFRDYHSLICLIMKIYEAKINTCKLIKKNETKTNNNINNTTNDKKIQFKLEINETRNIKFQIDESVEGMLPPKRKKGRNINKNNDIINNNDINELDVKKKSVINSIFHGDKIINQILFDKKNQNNEINSNIHQKYKEILKYTDNEINSFEYEKAIKFDKRSYFQYYISLLKSGNFLLFAFYSNNNDYNSHIIKIFLFFFFFSVDLTINALFFSDNTMHKIYIDEGSFNFIYQLPQIIYSFLISNVIKFLIKYLSLSEDNISEVKQIKKYKKNNLKLKFEKLHKTLKIKFALFFIISFILLLVLGYYNICFCGVYENTQIHLLKDTIISLGFSFIYPFGIYLIPGIFRIKSLKVKNEKNEYLYKFSKFIQNL